MIPRMYVIVCEELPDRLRAVNNYLNNMNLDFSLFPGVHGKTWGFAGSFPGHVGLNLTHWWLWRFLETRPESETEWIICEDDITLPHDFVDAFQRFYRKLPEDWQLVFLGHYVHHGGVYPMANGEVYTGCTTHAYLVHRSALSILIDTNKQTDVPIDKSFAMFSLPRLKHFCCHPSMIGQKSLEGLWPTSLEVGK